MSAAAAAVDASRRRTSIWPSGWGAGIDADKVARMLRPRVAKQLRAMRKRPDILCADPEQGFSILCHAAADIERALQSMGAFDEQQ